MANGVARNGPPDPADMPDAMVELSISMQFMKLGWPATRVAKAWTKYPDPRVLLRELRKYVPSASQTEGGGLDG